MPQNVNTGTNKDDAKSNTPEVKKTSPLADADLTDRPAEDDTDQTWVSAKDVDGEVQRIRSEEYPAWEKEQEAERARRG
jgi:hypothetical protein